MQKVMNFAGLNEDDEIEHGMISKSIENAQKKVEGNNFGIRKHLLQYDQVMNEQREVIYGERNKVIDGADLRDNVLNMLKGVISRAVDRFTSEDNVPEEWDIKGLNDDLLPIFHKPAIDITPAVIDSLTKNGMKEDLYATAVKIYEKKETDITPERMREVERAIMIKAIDHRWMDHIDDMDQMRQGISLRSYAQRDPLIEYKFLGYEMFDDMSNGIQLETVRHLFNVTVVQENQPVMQETVDMDKISTNSSETAGQVKKPTRRADDKIGRNDPCPCGSGKKFKQCCVNK